MFCLILGSFLRRRRLIELFLLFFLSESSWGNNTLSECPHSHPILFSHLGACAQLVWKKVPVLDLKNYTVEAGEFVFDFHSGSKKKLNGMLVNKEIVQKGAFFGVEVIMPMENGVPSCKPKVSVDKIGDWMFNVRRVILSMKGIWQFRFILFNSDNLKIDETQISYEFLSN